MSHEREEEPALGEWSGTRQWYRGEPPTVVPAARTVGTPECIEKGERPGLPIVAFTPGTCGRLLPRDCYVRADEQFDTNVFDCRFVWYAAEIIRRDYVDADDAEAFARIYFGNVPEYYHVNESEDNLFPQFLIVHRGTEVYVFFTGTQQDVQWLWQIMAAVPGPLDFGTYGTAALWEFAARRAIEQIQLAVGAGITRYVLCGHSYGGAVAQILACKLLGGTDGATIELLTFGCPKPGDQRVIDLLENLPQNHVVNEGDIVPWVIPNGLLGLFINPVIATLLSAWNRWRRPHVLTYIPRDGEPQRVTADNFQDGPMMAAAVALATGLSPDPGSEHFMPTYADRCKDTCPHLVEPFLPPALVRVTLDNAVVRWSGATYAVSGGYVIPRDGDGYHLPGSPGFSGERILRPVRNACGDIVGCNIELEVRLGVSATFIRLRWNLPTTRYWDGVELEPVPLPTLPDDMSWETFDAMSVGPVPT